jgi:hypothetical protein
VTAAVPVGDIAYGDIDTNEAVVAQAATGTKSTEEIVKDYFSDIPVMVQIARCESQFRQTLPDGSVLRGKVDPDDMGVMQINSRYHSQKAAELGLDLSNIYDNMKYARYLYETKGTQPWNSSSACWGRTIAMK